MVGPLGPLDPGVSLEHSAKKPRPLLFISMLLTALSMVVMTVGGCTRDPGLPSGGSAGEVDGIDGDTTSPGAQAVGGIEGCRPPSDTTPVDVTPFDEGPDLDMVSFDGVRIRLHWLPHPEANATDPHPTVLMGPGWSLSGARSIDDSRILGSTSTRSLQEAGYNILTWDPRGFGMSEGTAMVDSADFEGRDVQQMIDWLATLPEVRLDADRDPRIGMIGGSYGGGIALVGAAVDCRVDAVVATAAWHSLETSLYREQTVKIGWVEVLVSAALGHSLDEHIENAVDDAIETGVLDDDERRWFVERGPGDLIDQITAPVLLIQGTVDTLFTLDEAIENHRRLSENGVTVAMLWNCDGHGLCLTEPGDEMRSAVATIDWLNRYVGDDPTVALGAGFDTIDQNGRRYVADRYVGEAARYLSVEGSGKLTLDGTGGAPAIPEGLATGQLLDQLASGITPARATNAVDVTFEAGEDAMVVGSPIIDLRYSGTLSHDPSGVSNGDGIRPTRVFAQLVDEETGLVIGNQTTPVQLVLDGTEQRVSIPLESISFSVEPGSRVTLQLTPSTVAYAVPQMGPTVVFDRIELRLPVAEWLRPVDVESDTN